MKTLILVITLLFSTSSWSVECTSWMMNGPGIRLEYPKVVFELGEYGKVSIPYNKVYFDTDVLYALAVVPERRPEEITIVTSRIYRTTVDGKTLMNYYPCKYKVSVYSGDVKICEKTEARFVSGFYCADK